MKNLRFGVLGLGILGFWNLGFWVLPDGLLFLAALGLYVKTLSPGVYTFDSAELAAGAYSLGIVHPTGYPLYLLLAKLFTLLVPFGDVAYRVNLFSALCAALALVVLRRIAFNLTGSPAASLLAAAIFGVTYALWSEAVVAEVYTLHILFLALTLWLALTPPLLSGPSTSTSASSVSAQDAPLRRGGRGVRFTLLMLTFGLSFGNHMSTILIAPGLAALIWKRLPPRRTLIAGLAALAIGPLTYLYLPIRYAANPALNYAPVLGIDLSTLPGIFSMVRGEIFADAMFAYSPAELPREIFDFVDLLWQSFFGIGLVVAAVGAWEQWRRNRPLFAALGLIFAANVIFYLNYRVFDKHTMFLPAFFVVALWLAVGLSKLQEQLRLATWGAGVVLIVMLAFNYPRVDLSGNTIVRDYAEQRLDAVPPNALILGGWIDITPLEYLQVVEGRRPDVTLFDPGLYTLGRRSALRSHNVDESAIRPTVEAEIQGRVLNALAAGRAVYSLDPNPVLEMRFVLVEEGGMWRVEHPR